MKTMVRAALAGMALVVAATGTVAAQSRVDASRDWSVFEAGANDTKICWVVSQPTKSTATRGGKAVQVRRGDIFLMVAVRPGDNVKNEVSFLSGYPFQANSNVTVTVRGKQYTMFTDGENAWTRNASEDNSVTAAFKAGINAVIQGVSQRGTTTRDTFSLRGFTAALASATTRCQ